MKTPSPGYSAAQEVRSGGPAPVRQALLAARQRTLTQLDAWAEALGAKLGVAYRTTLNPPLWELGHIGWFQEYWVTRNRQLARGILCEPDHQRGPSLLKQADSWYDSSHVPHRTRWELPLPDLNQTRAYLEEGLAATLVALDGLGPDASESDLYFFRLVALHEEMHAEAGAYMARALGVSVPTPAPRTRQMPISTLSVPAQVFRVGYAGPGFAFDNELGAHDVALSAFDIDSQPVSWSGFQAFIDAGGYDQPKWWSEEGWRWRQLERPAPPHTALADGTAPAMHLSAYEAQAWCRWAGRRLPTEAEWECAALTMPGFEWGTVWEWTATAFEPYPGFVAHPYRDYSAPWFSTRRVLRGACTATSPSLAHPRYRNFFEPHRHDIFAGFRSCA